MWEFLPRGSVRTCLKISSSFRESNTALYYRLDEIVTDAQSTIESVKPVLDSYKHHIEGFELTGS